MIHPCNPDILALFARGLKVVHDTHVYKFKDFSECVFDTQIQSKNWLVDTLYDHRDKLGDIKRVSVLASWYGVAFVPIMLRKFPDVIIDLYDVDWYTADIAEYIFKDHNNVNVHCKDVIFDNVEFEGGGETAYAPPPPPPTPTPAPVAPAPVADAAPTTPV